MPRKVISFDGDNTLWDFEAAQRSALGSVLEVLIERGAPANILDVDRMIAIRRIVGDEMGEEAVPLLTLRRESLRRAAIEAGLDVNDEITSQLFTTYVAERDIAITAYENASDVLSKLKSDGWTIALLTNGNADARATGLSGFFDVLLYAEQIGVRKPDVAAFQAVSDATDSLLQDLVHVGDSLEHDVAGANAAGAVSVWLNRNCQAPVENVSPDFEISKLSQLPRVLNLLR